MGFRGWILQVGIIVGVFSSSTYAANSDCVAQAEMQQIAQHFTQFKELANKGDYCPENTKEWHLIAGIMFMRKTQFAASMPKSADELFSGTFANPWYDYFIGRIHDFSVQDSCPKGVGAYVYFFGNTMYVCPMLLSDNFTALDRASVFMHEARHIDGFPHVTCTRGARAGLQGACDDQISSGGSYAVTVETYAQISKYAETVHPALRAYSRSAAIVFADEAFESPVRVDRQEQFLALTTDGQFHVLNTNKSAPETKMLGQAPALGHIVMRGQHMALYPDDKNLPAKYVFARGEGDIQQAAGDIATEYNNSAPAQRATWVDVHIGAQWSAQLFNDRVKFTCDPRSTTTVETSLGREVPVGFVYPTGYDRAARLIYLVTESKKIYELGCEVRSNKSFLRASSLVLDQEYKRIHKAGGSVVGLTKDGRLFKIESNKSTALQTVLDGRVHEIVPNVSVDFLDAI